MAIRRRADFLAVVACAHVDMSEDEQAASAMFAPARGSHKTAMYLLDSSAADTWGQAAGALEARLTADAALRDELNAHESHMLDVCGLPQTSWLGRCQFAIFLHMMAILRSAGGAYVPAQLLSRLGAHCRELEVDVMMQVQRYLYFCCALRNVAAEVWQGSAYCVFLPRTQGARSWWAAMQTCLQECDLWAYFVDEYLLWPAPDPGGEDFPSFGAALRAASKRAQMSEVSEPAPVPDLHFLVHDTLLSAEEVLACPRVLAPLRPTARAAEGSWGGNDGSYVDVTPQNVVQGRSRAEFGALFARQLASRNLHEVTVLDFMDGAGVRFCSDDSRAWARALPADKDVRKCQQAFVHTMWGGRAQPVWDGYTRSYQLVQQCCPYMLQKSRMCRGNEAIAGLGAACDQWHALSADHGTTLKMHALSFLGTLASPNRGTWDTDNVQKLRNIGFYQQVACACGLTRTHSEQYHKDRRQQLQLQQLPRFLPRLYPDGQRDGLIDQGHEFVTYLAGTHPNFSAQEVKWCMRAEKYMRDLHESLQRLLERARTGDSKA